MDENSRSVLFPAVAFGVHPGLQHTTPEALQEVWRLVEDLGFDWISVFDHLYAANGTSDAECLESVAMHTLLAATTRRVRCGSLVYVPSYRHPAILAKAAATMDIISGGRVTLGLGAGWHRREYEAFGLVYESRPKRIKQLHEALRCVDALLNGAGPATFSGEFFRLDEARCEPRPVQRRLPLWIGGGGEQLTLRVAAEADGWNVPFVAPEVFRHKKAVLAGHCEKRGRSVSEITCSVNIGLAWTEDDLLEQFGRNAEQSRPAVLHGSVQQMRDLIGAYVDAGADQINVAVRPRKGRGHQLEGFERLAGVLGLVPLRSPALEVVR
ncbi:LLM class flavin-dependent oxidoreductase [Micromonospora sp. WMMD1120]|uniref:LLM class flavin-dependent oxidoreductase n=1 Tax=Micromonospora sp. WMMD1120 TaxID=3016106 RepID=UPI00241665A7|nr:LLM class flavin-dependent oxidoreductase [Micromonospora sp. WMMD1120]MDG4807547.1 LLM class flavin-dependent oxidoreductase [Micromonospora sp. WMMD1120]